MQHLHPGIIHPKTTSAVAVGHAAEVFRNRHRVGETILDRLRRCSLAKPENGTSVHNGFRRERPHRLIEPSTGRAQYE